MCDNVYCGRGSHIPYVDYMDLINLSFGFSTPETQFLGLLPKLYREEYRPQDQNYVVTENNVLTAAVGAYDHEIIVCGRRIPCRGIGNVAVHPEHRSKGYMKAAMNAALEDMIKDGIVISTLGGRRQRYLYFGYDKAAPLYSYSITKDNIRHVFGDFNSPYTVKEVLDPTDPIIDSILALNHQLPVIPVRPRERYLDIANTWKAKLIVFMDNDRFVGYCILDGGGSFISEIQTVEELEFLSVIRSLYAYLDKGFSVHILPHQLSYRRDITPIAEGMSLAHAMHFNILNYRCVIEAFLALKQTYISIPDGEVTLLIHGYAGDECLRVSVKNGEANVSVNNSTAFDYELSHAEALSFLFSPISPIRETANDICKLWFPLPLCMLRADEV